MVQKRVFVFITRFARAARLVTVVTLVTLDRVAAKQRSGIALVLSSTTDINHQRRETPPLRRSAASRAHVSIADPSLWVPIFCARYARTHRMHGCARHVLAYCKYYHSDNLQMHALLVYSMPHVGFLE